MNKQEAITKLTELNNLLDEFGEEMIKSDKGGSLITEYTKIFNQIKKQTGKLTNVPAVITHFPNYNYKLYDINGLETQKKELLKKSAIIAGVALLSFLISKISIKLFFFNYIAIISFFVLLYFGSKVNNIAKEYNEKKQKNDKSLEKFIQEEKDFLETIKTFDSDKKIGMQTALEYKETVIKAIAESKVQVEQLQKKTSESKKRKEELTEEINKYDFVPLDYIQYVPTVLNLLKSGRADDYKEALNLAIAEEKDAEERAQRAEEDRRRTMLLQEQAEEERRHNLQMEQEQATANRIQAEQAAQARRAEQQRQRVEDRAARDARDRQLTAERNAMNRCSKCANRFACGSARGQVNCGAFVPDKVFK